MLKQTIAFLLLVGCVIGQQPTKQQNFTANDPELVRQAEEARAKGFAYWGYTAPVWSMPCPISVFPSQAATGATSFSFQNGGVSNWNMRIGNTDVPAALTHEVDHTVRASIVGGKIPRWLDEGTAEIVQIPDKYVPDHCIRARKVTWIGAKELELGSSTMEAAYNDPSRVMDIYDFGYTATQMLLEMNTQHTLICFQQDKRSVAEKFPDYYDMTSEQFVAYWRTRVMQDDFCTTRIRWMPYPEAYPIRNGKPLLELWTAPAWCAPCRTLQQDMDSDPQFRALLTQNYHIHIRNFDNPYLSVEKVLKNIKAVPTMVVPAKRIRVVGYSHDQPPAIRKQKLLDQLQIGTKGPNPYIKQTEPPVTFPPSSVVEAPVSVPDVSVPKDPQSVPAPSPGVSLGEPKTVPETRSPPEAPGSSVSPPNSEKVSEVIPPPPNASTGQPEASTGLLRKGVGGVLGFAANWMLLGGIALLVTGVGGGIGGPMVVKWASGKIGTTAATIAADIIKNKLEHKKPPIVNPPEPIDTGIAVPQLPKPPIPPICPPEPQPAPVPQPPQQPVVVNCPMSRQEVGPTIKAPFPRRLDEAGELLALRQSEGRVVTLDAIRGMLLDDEMTHMEEKYADDPEVLKVLFDLKQSINHRVDEIAPLTTKVN